MAPSIPHKKHDARSSGELCREMTLQTTRRSLKTVQQPQRTAVRKMTGDFRKSSPKADSGIPNVGELKDREDDADVRSRVSRVLDPTLPKEEKERDVWARKLYYALLNGPNFYEEAGVKAWEVLRSTEELYRSGPSAASLNDTRASQIAEQLNNVSFARHFEKLVRFVNDQRVKSEVIGCSAEELLMKLAEPEIGKGNTTPPLHEHDEKTVDYVDLTMETEGETRDYIDLTMDDDVGTGNYIDLTMEPSDDDSSDGSDAGEDVAGRAVFNLGESSTGQSHEGRGRVRLESVSKAEEALTMPTFHARTYDTVIIKPIEISESEDVVERVVSSADHGDMKVDVLSKGMTSDRAACVDPDPFWRVHVETMKRYSHRYR